jgi:hypothetical protein
VCIDLSTVFNGFRVEMLFIPSDFPLKPARMVLFLLPIEERKSLRDRCKFASQTGLIILEIEAKPNGCNDKGALFPFRPTVVLPRPRHFAARFLSWGVNDTFALRVGDDHPPAS